MESTLIVLRDSVSPNTLEQLAALHQWRLTEDRQRCRVDEPFQRAYQTSAEVELRYVEDHLINVKTLRISGENYAPELEVVRKDLAHFSKEEALSECSSAQGSALIGALYKLCQFGSDAVDHEILAAYEKASKDPTLGVRRASITAMAYTPWKECIAVLEDLARRDSRLRAKAMQLVEAIDPNKKTPSDSNTTSKSKQKKRR